MDASTATAAPTSGIVSTETRKSWRQAYGDLPALLAAAKQERDAGQLENAYTAYRLALGQWLRERWLEHSYKPNSPIADPQSLATKLRSAGKIDPWTHSVLKITDQRPAPVEWAHVEILGATVESLHCATAATTSEADKARSVCHA